MSGGWVFFVGGVSGVIAVARAKNFSWSNSEFLESEDDVRERVPMTFKRRMVLLLVCLLISAYGAWQLESEHAWNPFTRNQPDQTQHQ
jgi:hypothetical protein